MKNKKGQYFILAAVIIVIVLFSLIYSNSYGRVDVFAKERKEAENLYKEIGNVIDYCMYNDIPLGNCYTFITSILNFYKDKGWKIGFCFHDYRYNPYNFDLKNCVHGYLYIEIEKEGQKLVYER